MSVNLEIEKTFLARLIPDEVKDAASLRIEDVYIPEDADMALLRIRKKGRNYEITKKITQKPSDYSSHEEHTIALDEREYIALKRSSSRVITKTRYFTTIDGKNAEVDVFDGDLDGLVMIDFEFSDQKSAEEFIAPKCCLVDVTQERQALGGQLAGKSYKDIEEWLEGFGYTRLKS